MSVNWEERYQLGDTPWDKRAPHPALVDFLQNQGSLRGNVLVPGCGAGYDVRAVSSPENTVVGLDIAPSAIERANSFPKIANECYELADFFHLPQRFLGAFDWVLEHTCFCAIDPALRSRYADVVADALKPGGILLAVFFLDPDMSDGETGPPFGVTLAELHDLFGQRFRLLREWTPARTFEGREHRERMQILQKQK